MKIIFLVGNGFNYLIEDIIKHHEFDNGGTPDELKHKRETSQGISNITALWKKFDTVFAEFETHFKERGMKISHEDLVRMVYTVINLFSSMPGLSQVLAPEDIGKLRDIFSKFLLDKIREIADEFMEHHNSGQYGEIRRYLPTFSSNVQAILMENHVQKANFCTTNYDGILDTLLTKQPKGFITDDGFRSTTPPSSVLDIYPSYLSSKSLVLTHLHGSYLYTKRFGKTYKTNDYSSNDEPVMVFNDPKMKREIIRSDSVLWSYFLKLNGDLKEFDKLIIFGNSMSSEPHIKTLIQNNFNRPNTVIVIASRSPEKVTRELEAMHEGKPVYTGRIVEKSTEGIRDSDSLFALIRDMIVA